MVDQRRAVLAAVGMLLLSLWGCDATPAPPPGISHAAPHGGSLVRLGDQPGYVEILCRDPAGAQPGKSSDFEIAVYFLAEDATSPFAAPLEDVTISLNLPDGPRSMPLQPLTDAPKAYLCPAGPYGHKGAINGEVAFTLQGKPGKAPFAFR